MASSIGLGSGEHAVASDTTYAGWWSRVGATLIDALVLLVPVIVLGGILAAVGIADAGIVIGYLLYLVATLFYAPVMMAREGARNGQTIGKQVTNIRVVREDGQAMTLGRGMVREAIGKSLLGLIPLYSIVDLLFPLGDKRNQALHDKIGSTTVRTA